MRIPKQFPFVSIFDAVIFFVTYGIHVLGHGPILQVANVFYWMTMCGGLVLAILSFISLITGGESQLKRSVVCALFAFIPACFGVVAALSHFGTPVGGVHLS